MNVGRRRDTWQIPVADMPIPEAPARQTTLPRGFTIVTSTVSCYSRKMQSSHTAWMPTAVIRAFDCWVRVSWYAPEWLRSNVAFSWLHFSKDHCMSREVLANRSNVYRTALRNHLRQSTSRNCAAEFQVLRTLRNVASMAHSCTLRAGSYSLLRPLAAWQCQPKSNLGGTVIGLCEAKIVNCEQDKVHKSKRPRFAQIMAHV